MRFVWVSVENIYLDMSRGQIIARARKTEGKREGQAGTMTCRELLLRLGWTRNDESDQHYVIVRDAWIGEWLCNERWRVERMEKGGWWFGIGFLTPTVGNGWQGDYGT